ncbi:MAG: helix-turn-helix domain-containing protein [Prolixibacteraceae bacterium]|nr:helix-turn-helix domain-containing protein [Prolixibacteraceae bacterium]
MEYQNNPQLKLAYDFLQYTNQNIFLTGKAGTGKTTFLKNIKKVTPKRMVVVAPTGVAAINAGGVTIHSFFQLSFGPQISSEIVQSEFDEIPETLNENDRIKRFSKNKINLIRSLDLLVIDEISMVRADILDAIDAVLRRFKNRYRPFGGLQVLMIGDLQQLAPVVRDEEWSILGKYYDSCFFFSSHALQKSNFISIELKHIYRQSDQSFINLLNKVRDNKMDSEDLQLLNSRLKPDFSPGDDEGYITLTTHNHQARRINETQLSKLNSKLFTFKCRVEGDFPASSYPAEEVLEVKTGAQVMFLKNDTSSEKRYFNGKIGTVTAVYDEYIEVMCQDETEPVMVGQDIWENTKYRLNEKTVEIEENVAGKFIQYPLKLAWAITIHKSQGLTFEKAVIDARQSFAHGQVYVALSRCKSLEGLILSTPLSNTSVIKDNTVAHFSNESEHNQPGEAELKKYREEYEVQLLKELFDFKPVLGIVSYILKIWKEDERSLMGNLGQELKNIVTPLKTEIIDVAVKFYMQIEQLTAGFGHPESNKLLQERVKKAADYFLDKLNEQIVPRIENISFETDNSAVRKRISGAVDKLENQIEIKKACLDSVTKGFKIKNYLNAKALASVARSGSHLKRIAVPAGIANPDLYKRLLKWRSEKSVETGVPESRLLSQKVMKSICEKLPSTAKNLKSIKGMGGKKMELAGQDLLAMILNYRSEKGLDIPANATEEVALAGLETREVSLVLLRKGLKPSEIAKKRSLAVSTIEGHLAHFVSKGILDIFDVIDRKKFDLIADELNKTSDQDSLTAIKIRLGNDFSYGEIKLVSAALTR